MKTICKLLKWLLCTRHKAYVEFTFITEENNKITTMSITKMNLLTNQGQKIQVTPKYKGQEVPFDADTIEYVSGDNEIADVVEDETNEKLATVVGKRAGETQIFYSVDADTTEGVQTVTGSFIVAVADRMANAIEVEVVGEPFDIEG